jgi:hypothetical protein
VTPTRRASRRVSEFTSESSQRPATNPQQSRHNRVSFARAGYARGPSAPNGGLLERFDGLYSPTLGIDFNGATPPDAPYDTDIYTLEYDGWADFPQYPINFLSDLNAFASIQFVHRQYPTLTPDELARKTELRPSDGNTTYWMIPTDHLPLTQLLSEVQVAGKPLADLLEPDLKLLVNLGYDNPNPDEGWSVDRDVPTQFGLFPSMDQVTAALRADGAGHAARYRRLDG